MICVVFRHEERVYTLSLGLKNHQVENVILYFSKLVATLSRFYGIHDRMTDA